jgi:hypothetical protein
MKDKKWFSATLRFFIVNSVGGRTRAEDSVFFAATGFEDALAARAGNVLP